MHRQLRTAPNARRPAPYAIVPSGAPSAAGPPALGPIAGGTRHRVHHKWRSPWHGCVAGPRPRWAWTTAAGAASGPVSRWPHAETGPGRPGFAGVRTSGPSGWGGAPRFAAPALAGGASPGVLCAGARTDPGRGRPP